MACLLHNKNSMKEWEKWKPDDYNSLSLFQQLIVREIWLYLKKHENNGTVDYEQYIKDNKGGQ